jgi:hypothetical protein
VRRGGRPLGARNRKTIEREIIDAELRATTPPGGAGRPKGSRNKATIEREIVAAEVRAGRISGLAWSQVAGPSTFDASHQIEGDRE